MQETRAQLEQIQEEINRVSQFLKIESLIAEEKELSKKAEDPNLWNDQENARQITKKLAEVSETIKKWQTLKKNTEDLIELTFLIKSEESPEEAEDLKKQAEQLINQVQKESIIVFFSGPHDQKDALLSFHVGTGGTDAQDWAEILFRMYLRFAEKKGWQIEILDKSEGEEAGIKSATVRVTGRYAYGFLKHEMGVHRLVRLSPFNSKGTRETSFALVEVLPDLGDEHEQVEINKEDLKIETFRASGHGGQGVNTTDSAVRIVHIPTGITVQCQNERSQLQNKEQAMRVLKAKLIKLQEEQMAEDINKLRGGKLETSWGHQIRSYVLHPYKMVKDHRTNHETAAIEAVLDGDLDQFIEIELETLK